MGIPATARAFGRAFDGASASRASQQVGAGVAKASTAAYRTPPTCRRSPPHQASVHKPAKPRSGAAADRATALTGWPDAGIQCGSLRWADHHTLATGRDRLAEGGHAPGLKRSGRGENGKLRCESSGVVVAGEVVLAKASPSAGCRGERRSPASPSCWMLPRCDRVAGCWLTSQTGAIPSSDPAGELAASAAPGKAVAEDGPADRCGGADARHRRNSSWPLKSVWPTLLRHRAEHRGWPAQAGVARAQAQLGGMHGKITPPTPRPTALRSALGSQRDSRLAIARDAVCQATRPGAPPALQAQRRSPGWLSSRVAQSNACSSAAKLDISPRFSRCARVCCSPAPSGAFFDAAMSWKNHPQGWRRTLEPAANSLDKRRGVSARPRFWRHSLALPNDAYEIFAVPAGRRPLHVVTLTSPGQWFVLAWTTVHIHSRPDQRATRSTSALPCLSQW